MLGPAKLRSGCLLLFGDPSISSPALGRALDALERSRGANEVAGMMAAPGEKAAAVWVNGLLGWLGGVYFLGVFFSWLFGNL